MKRIHLFELEDFPWFPAWLRQDMTLFLVAFHRLTQTSQHLAPLLARLCRMTGMHQIVDLCSGGTGPMVDVFDRLRSTEGLGSVRLTFTDLYPNKIAAENIRKLGKEGLTYRLEPVDATHVPADLKGVRTMVASFHHMSVPNARKILEDAWKQRQPICTFEPGNNPAPVWLMWVAFPFVFLLAVVLAPFLRPLSARILFFTYVIPLLPLCIAWDGMVSGSRIYNTADLKELTASYQSPDYQWEMGEIPGRGGRMQYLLGIPQNV
ncbi:hypothetical protein K2X33_04200 [bacterium]|nr:hypothetical protein [bacterium]